MSAGEAFLIDKIETGTCRDHSMEYNTLVSEARCKRPLASRHQEACVTQLDVSHT
jgi:hypothetical protein